MEKIFKPAWVNVECALPIRPRKNPCRFGKEEANQCDTAIHHTHTTGKAGHITIQERVVFLWWLIYGGVILFIYYFIIIIFFYYILYSSSTTTTNTKMKKKKIIIIIYILKILFNNRVIKIDHFSGKKNYGGGALALF